MPELHNIVRVTGVTKVFKLKKLKVEALRGVDLEIRTGEYLSIMGPSGSGKSTLFNMIGGLDKPTSGKVFIDEVDIAQLDAYELAWLRCRKIGYIFQTFNLIPVLTAYENVEFPLLLRDFPAAERKDKIMEVLEEVGIKNQAQQRPEELSGGQRQRVAIARALVKGPEIILADEPTANLDSATGDTIIKLMLKLNQERGTTFIFSTHDQMVMDYARRLVMIRDGGIEDDRVK